MSSSEDKAAPITEAKFDRLLRAMEKQMQSRYLAEERTATKKYLVKCINLEKKSII